MWSFLCGAGKARPTYLSVCPCGVAKVGSDAFLRWFEALWLLLHHVLTGSIKLSLDLGILNVDEGALSGNMLPAKHLLQLWVAGAMFEHVACGMRHFGIKGSASTRVLSVVLRFSAALTLTITQNTPLRMAMAWDVFWMLVRLAINFKRVSASSALLRSQSVGDPLRDPERGAAPDGVAGGKKEGLCAMIGRLNDADVALSAEEEERLLLITRDPEIPARRRSPTQAPPSPAPIYNSARNSAQAARNSARASGRGPSDSMQGVLPPPSTPPPGFTEVGIDSVPSSEERAPSGKSKRKSLVETTAL